jgi:hypothetical protein
MPAVFLTTADSSPWTIFYGNWETTNGITKEDWLAAPSAGVQVVVKWQKPELHERRWRGVDDRLLWTGEDVYDPFGWGPKVGELISDNEYQHIWNLAAYGQHNA